MRVPPDLREAYRDRDWVEVWNLVPFATTWRLEHATEPALYLKANVSGSDERATLADEGARMTWARGAGLPCPEVVALGEVDGVEWLVTMALPGTSAWTHPWRDNRQEEVVQAAAHALRRLHDEAPSADCPFDEGAAVALGRRRQRHARGELQWDHIHPDHSTRSLDDALDWLERNTPSPAARVVCHGDYAAPNVLLDGDGALTGFVDVGRLGVADRWWDLAVGSWYAIFDFGPWAEHAFLQAYGVERDEGLIEYYRLLYSLG